MIGPEYILIGFFIILISLFLFLIIGKPIIEKKYYNDKILNKTFSVLDENFLDQLSSLYFIIDEQPIKAMIGYTSTYGNGGHRTSLTFINLKTNEILYDYPDYFKENWNVRISDSYNINTFLKKASKIGKLREVI